MRRRKADGSLTNEERHSIGCSTRIAASFMTRNIAEDLNAPFPNLVDMLIGGIQVPSVWSSSCPRER
jgi:hypothetical protein